MNERLSAANVLSGDSLNTETVLAPVNVSHSPDDSVFYSASLHHNSQRTYTEGGSCSLDGLYSTQIGVNWKGIFKVENAWMAPPGYYSTSDITKLTSEANQVKVLKVNF